MARFSLDDIENMSHAVYISTGIHNVYTGMYYGVDASADWSGVIMPALDRFREDMFSEYGQLDVTGTSETTGYLTNSNGEKVFTYELATRGIYDI